MYWHFLPQLVRTAAATSAYLRSMFYYRFALLFMAAAPLASAQTFDPVPGALLQKEVAMELANECYIFFDNPGGDSLRLRWKRMENSSPADWIMDLCDFGLCYVGIPAGGLMNPATGNEQAYLKLIVQPGLTPGAAWLWFRVWEDGNPANFADVFFDLHTPGVTSSPEVFAKNIRVFPNPASGMLFLEHAEERSMPVWLTDATGRPVWTGEVAPGERRSIDLSPWPAGLYFLKTDRGTRLVQRVH